MATPFVLEEGPRHGLPVVLIHGFPFDHTMWLPQVAALRQDYRTIAYDVRGLGRSPAGSAPATMDRLVEDLTGLLDDLGIESVVLCGLSMGGYIALRLAEREPRYLRGLVLADTRSTPDAEPAKQARLAAVGSIQKDGLGPFAEASLKQVLAPQTFSQGKPCLAMARSMILANDPQGVIFAAHAIMSRTDTTRVLPGIRVPTLVLAGQYDPITTPQACQALAVAIPAARYAEIPDAGHLSNLENPGAFNKRLLDFLQSLPR